MTCRLLLVDDSAVFRMMVSRDLLNKGFDERTKGMFSNGDIDVYVVAEFEPARDMLAIGSSAHMDFRAVFLDWQLCQSDRAKHYDGVQLALMAIEPKNQPMLPTIYCISAESTNMRLEILAKAGPRLAPDRVVIANFMTVVEKMIESVSGPPARG